MTFETDLKTVLAAVCPRVHADFAPAKTAKPYITFQQIGGDVINPLDNALPGRKNAEMQINVWAATRAEAKSLIDQVEAAMRAATAYQARPTAAAVSDFDADVPIYGSLQTFSCWYVPS